MNILSHFYSRGSDAKYFTTTKKGEIYELRSELNHEKKDKKKDAVKRVIANMTVGKDVGVLFADVLKCMQTDDLELKKLVYLYLMNYSKSHPELVILAINSFVKDSEDSNPLLRALAIRTMGCIRVNQMVDYLREPVRKCLRDHDPYVRKTAATCVTKLFDLNPTLVQESDLLQLLHNLLADPNPSVVVSALSALLEIYDALEASQHNQKFEIDSENLMRLLAALNECNEWGQIIILDAISYRACQVSSMEAEHIIERIVPRLQHANAAVVLSSIKILSKYAPQLDQPATRDQVMRKLGPPLVSLLAAEQEVQYIALRNIYLLLEKDSTILKDEMKMFFCKYNDLPSVKLEKLNILIRLASDVNVDQILAELKEYATEVDVIFVRRSICAIGQCAIKVERSADRCVQILLDLISSKVTYVVQEGILVVRDIFRKYPNKYEGILPIICSHLESLQEGESKAALIWIIGEYADRIDNAYDLLDFFMKGFRDEDIMVQLQLLSSIVKLFLRRPASTQALVQRVLSLSTEGSQHPDLRDRGFVYWRLLSGSPAAAVSTVLQDRPPIAIESDSLDPSIVDSLVNSLGSVGTVLHRLPETFIASIVNISVAANDQNLTKNSNGIENSKMSNVINLLELDDGEQVTKGNDRKPIPSTEDLVNFFVDDIDGSRDSKRLDAVGESQEAAKNMFLSENDKKQWFDSENVRILGRFRKEKDLIFMDVTITSVKNESVPLDDIALQFNKNSFGIMPKMLVSEAPNVVSSSVDLSWLLDFGSQKQKMNPLNLVQIALRTHGNSVIYFSAKVPLTVLLIPPTLLSESPFFQLWNSLPAVQKTSIYSISQRTNIKALLENHQIMLTAEASSDKEYVGYYIAKTANNILMFIEVSYYRQGEQVTVNVTIKTKIPDILPYMVESLHLLFQPGK